MKYKNMFLVIGLMFFSLLWFRDYKSEIHEKIWRNFQNMNVISVGSLISAKKGTICAIYPYTQQVNGNNGEIQKINSYLKQIKYDGDNEWGLIVYNSEKESFHLTIINKNPSVLTPYMQREILKTFELDDFRISQCVNIESAKLLCIEFENHKYVMLGEAK